MDFFQGLWENAIDGITGWLAQLTEWCMEIIYFVLTMLRNAVDALFSGEEDDDGLLYPAAEFMNGIEDKITEFQPQFEWISYILPINECVVITMSTVTICLTIRLVRWGLSLLPFLNTG